VQAGAGCYISAVGQPGSVIVLVVPIIAVLGSAGLFLLASKSGMPEGEIRIRALGIRVRWGQSEIENSARQDSSHPIPNKKKRKKYRLWGMSRDD
jgi:hypothetical protein